METNATAPTTPAATPAAPAEAPKSAVDALFDKSKPAKAAANAAPSEVPPPKESAPPSDSAAKQMALIARESKRLAAEKSAWAKDRETQKSALDELKSLKALQEEIKTNPVKALKGLGMDYQKLVEAELARQEEEANPTIRKVRELEHKIAEKERIEAEQATKYAEAQQERLVADHVGQIRTHIAANAEKYEFLQTYKAEKDVFARIKEVFEASVQRDAEGRISSFKELTIEEACDQLEAEYEEAGSTMAQLKKMQAKIAKQIEAAAPKSTTKPTNAEPKAKSVTLTNALSGGSEKPRALTKEERRDRAYAALHGN